MSALVDTGATQATRQRGPLQGRRALVTGASSGIGAAVARALLDAGAEVHACARRLPELESVVGSAALAEGRGHVHAVDLSDPAQVDELCGSLADAPVDIVVAAAGTNVKDRRADLLTDEGYETVMSLNLDSVARLVRRTAPGMRGRGGDVVLISSISGAYPDHAGPAYAASKAGLIAFGRGVGRDLHAEGVRVTSVLPGIVDTPLLDKRPVPPPAEVRRWCLRPEDVAATVLAAVSLPPRAHIPEVIVLATRLQSIGGSQLATPELPEGLEGRSADQWEELS